MSEQPKKVLIIDDDLDLVDAFTIILTGSGFTAVSAQSGPAGLDLARSERPHLIILDVMMTTVNEGFETAQALRADAQLAAIPILMLTAVDQRYHLGFKDHLGSDYLPVDRFLEKPVEPKELTAVVREMLG